MADVEQSASSPADGGAGSATQPEETPAVSTDTAVSATGEQPSPADADDASGTREAQRVDELPEWAQSEIRKARDEAKKHRQSAKDHQQQAEQVPELQSQVEDLGSKLATAQHELSCLRAVLNTGKVSDSAQVLDVAGRLNGSTQDELDADAARLVELFGIGSGTQQRASDPTQGNGHQALNGDPMEAKVRRVLGV